MEKTQTKLSMEKTQTKLSQKAKDRIAVAEDVIARLKSGYLEATHHVYVTEVLKPRFDSFYSPEKDARKDTRDLLKHKVKTCRVCAKGALLISTIMKFDNFPANEHSCLLSAIACSNNYESPFSEHQLDDAESAYEGIGDESWTEKYPDPSKRLGAMMRNIIRNNGKFVYKDI